MNTDYWRHGDMHNMWWFLIWIPILILLVWGVVKVYAPKNTVKLIDEDSPMEILQKRFAKGELTTEEYQEKKRILQDDSAKNKEAL
jgi:putative membrane protein